MHLQVDRMDDISQQTEQLTEQLQQLDIIHVVYKSCSVTTWQCHAQIPQLQYLQNVMLLLGGILG